MPPLGNAVPWSSSLESAKGAHAPLPRAEDGEGRPMPAHPGRRAAAMVDGDAGHCPGTHSPPGARAARRCTVSVPDPRACRCAHARARGQAGNLAHGAGDALAGDPIRAAPDRDAGVPPPEPAAGMAAHRGTRPGPRQICGRKPAESPGPLHGRGRGHQPPIAAMVDRMDADGPCAEDDGALAFPAILGTRDATRVRSCTTRSGGNGP